VVTKQRLSVLQHYEELCYSICIYLVRCDKLAAEAAKNTLLQLAACDAFFAAADTEQKLLLRKESIRCSLEALKARINTAS